MEKETLSLAFLRIIIKNWKSEVHNLSLESKYSATLSSTNPSTGSPTEKKQKVLVQNGSQAFNFSLMC